MCLGFVVLFVVLFTEMCQSQYRDNHLPHSPPGGGGNLSFQDTGLCHSNRKSTTHKSRETSLNHTHKSGKAKTAHSSGTAHQINEFLQKTIPINPENAKKLLKTIPINPESIMKKVP